MTQQSPADNSAEDFDIAIIGAGINGAGVARDAAMRGLKALLLDKGDIGGGTSAWSTRLIHGGLRYLEHGEFGLVRESLNERETLLRIAPHLIKPLPILIPIYERGRRSSAAIRAGMLAYDLLSFGKSLSGHRMLSRAETLQEANGLAPSGLKGAALYYDAQAEFAERLVVENVLSAIKHGAVVRTYAKVTRLVTKENKVEVVEFTDSLTGEEGQARARIVINAVGPWVDQLLTNAGAASARLIGGTKGSHIVVPPFDGAPKMALYIEAAADARPFFIIPWNDNCLIGTTDIRYDGDLDDIRIEPHEIDYLLRETNRVIPSARLDRSNILYTYSGVRPLAFTGDKDEQSITRRHFIRKHPHFGNLFSLVGGKLTTYRSLAEKTIDLVFKTLGQNPPKCITHKTQLNGSDSANSRAIDASLISDGRLPDATHDHLLRTYGVASLAVMKLVSDDARLREVIDPETGAIAAEVVYAFQYELARTLSDCLLRRTMVGLNSTCGLNAIEAAATVAQECLGWPDERKEIEINMYRMNVERLLARDVIKGLN